MSVKLSTLQVPKFRRGKHRKHAKPERSELKAQNLFSEQEQKQILDDVHDLFDGTYSVIRPGPWKRSFRPSGFPYCPVIDALSGTEDMNYAKAFYLDIGTTVHALMQEYISRSARGNQMVYANWKCKKCNGDHLFTPLPYVCAFCGADNEQLAYEELEFSDAFGIDGGHVDLLIKTKWGWIVADWKTASENGMDYRNEADGKHHHQLQAYCLAIQELFKDKLEGLPVIGYMLIFVPRDASGVRSSDNEVKTSNWTPYLYKWTPQLAKETRRRLFVQRASYDAASVGYETGNWKPAALLRPCTTLAEFGKPMGMRDGFYKGEPCENLDTCCRTTADVVDFINKSRTEARQTITSRTAIIERQKADYLACASQGIIAPNLLAEIKLARNEENYDHEYVESLLAVKRALEALIAIKNALTKQKVTHLFSAPEMAKPAANVNKTTLGRRLRKRLKKARAA